MATQSTGESGSGDVKDGGQMDVDTHSLSHNLSNADPGNASVHPEEPSSAPLESNASQTLHCDDVPIPDTPAISLDDTFPRLAEKLLSLCNDETRLNSSMPSRRGVFAVHDKVIKSDHLAAEATGDYSAMDENEHAAVDAVARVLPDIQLPRCRFRMKRHDRDVYIRSRLPGTTLEAAWPHLAREQKINYKEQARNVTRQIHQVRRHGPSYCVETDNPRVSHKLDQKEYDILFGDTEQDGNDFGAVHNNLVPSNILVENNRIVGIIGWSHAGFFGWDRAKIVHSTLRCPSSRANEDSESDIAWDDLYDVQAEAPKPLLDDNARSNSAVDVKTEAPNQSLENVPHATAMDAAGSIKEDVPTPKKVTDLKRESTSRGPSSDRSSPSPSAIGSKKRAAPAAAAKRGGAKGKVGPKKRKLNGATDADAITTSRRGSLTPAPSRRGKTSTGRQLKRSSLSVASSPVPDDNAPDGVDENGDDDDDIDPSELFCICRKPDNHTWMIACDGGCEDWFHGKCVNINQVDADLIDKYICPSCEKKYNTRTTWKPMCRIPECRQPARVSGRYPSKYCSEEHGREFMRLKLGTEISRSNSHGAVESGTNTRSRASSFGLSKGRHRGSHADGGDEDGSNNEYEDEDDEMEVDGADGGHEDAYNSGSRGGVLTTGDLKAAVSITNSADEFRNLGGSVLMSQPPEIKSRFGSLDNNAIDEIDVEAQNIEFTSEERQQIQTFRDEKAKLRNHADMLRDRDKFLGLVRQQAKHILDRLRHADPKGATAWKDICGFDPRLSWSDEEFDQWRLSDGGKTALTGNLELPASANAETDGGGGDTEMADVKEDNVNKIAGGVCIKRRCEQHKQWLKVLQQDILFEQATVKEKLEKCEKNAKEVIEKVVMRIYGGDNTVPLRQRSDACHPSL